MTPLDSGRGDKPRRHRESAHRAIGEEGGLVVLPTKQVVKVLNPVGSRIFSLLDGKRTREEIVRVIVDEFDVSEAQARTDLESYLEELRTHGMLDEQDDAPRATGDLEGARS
jgi:hypothetical protein